MTRVELTEQGRGPKNRKRTSLGLLTTCTSEVSAEPVRSRVELGRRPRTLGPTGCQTAVQRRRETKNLTLLAHGACEAGRQTSSVSRRAVVLTLIVFP